MLLKFQIECKTLVKLFGSKQYKVLPRGIAYALKLAISKNQPEAEARVYMCECLNSVSTLYCLMYRRPNSFCYNIQYPALNEAFSTLSAFSDTNKEGILNEECLCVLSYCQEPSNCNLIIQTFSHTLTLLTLLNGSIQETSSCYNYAYTR